MLAQLHRARALPSFLPFFCSCAFSQPGDLRAHLITSSGESPDKYNWCDKATSRKGTLRSHLKAHSGEKSDKCYQCDFTCKECAYACSQASELKNHLKNLTNATNMTKHFPGQAFWGVAWKHTEEGGNQISNQCGFAPSHVSNLKTNVKTHSGKNLIIATNVTFHPHVQAIWGDIWQRTMEKNQTIATNLTQNSNI